MTLFPHMIHFSSEGLCRVPANTPFSQNMLIQPIEPPYSELSSRNFTWLKEQRECVITPMGVVTGDMGPMTWMPFTGNNRPAPRTVQTLLDLTLLKMLSNHIPWIQRWFLRTQDFLYHLYHQQCLYLRGCPGNNSDNPLHNPVCNDLSLGGFIPAVTNSESCWI